MPRRWKFVQKPFHYQIELRWPSYLITISRKKKIPIDPELHHKTTSFNCSPNSNLKSHGVVVAFLHTGHSLIVISHKNDDQIGQWSCDLCSCVWLYGIIQEYSIYLKIFHDFAPCDWMGSRTSSSIQFTSRSFGGRPSSTNDSKVQRIKRK